MTAALRVVNVWFLLKCIRDCGEAVMVQGCADVLPPPAGTSSPHCLMTDIQSLPVPLLCGPLL